MKCESAEENGKSVIHLFYRNEKGKRVHEKHEDFVPYFYVPSSADEKADARGIELGQEYGVPIKRFETKLSTDVPRERMKFQKTWCAKTYFNDRYLRDMVKTSLDMSPDVVMPLDLECVHTGGKWVITNIGYYNSSDRVYHELYYPWAPKPPSITALKKLLLQKGITVPIKIELVYSEEEIIKKWVEAVIAIDPDDFVGWNIQFDMKLLYENSQRYHKIDFKSISPMHDVHLRKGNRGRAELTVKGRTIFDLWYSSIELLPPQPAYNLRHIANKFIGFEKKDYRRKIQLLRETDPDELIRYNLGDVYCCVKLMEVKQLFNHFYARGRVAACNLESTYPMHKWIEHIADKILPLKMPTHLTTGGRKCQGPRLIDPVPGFHDVVIFLDFKGLYPAITKAWNMSPETMSPDGDLKVGNGICFKSQPKGMWPTLVDFFQVGKLQADKELKALDLKEADKLEHPIYHTRNAYKIATVAVTGLINWTDFCMFVPEILDSIFFVEREIIGHLEGKLKEWGIQPLYGHTDSIAIKVDSFDEVPKILEKVNKEVGVFCDKKGIKDHTFLIECEKKCKRIFFDSGHNRYAYISDKDELVVQGFEGKKVNVSDFGREVQIGLFRVILETTDCEKSKQYVSQKLSDLRSGALPLESASYYSTLRKDPQAYKKKTSALRAIEFSNLFRGSNEYPLLDFSDTHKMLPVKIGNVDPTILKGTNVDVKKVKLLALDLEDSAKDFLNFIVMSGKGAIAPNMEKIEELNITNRVSHIVEALQWDFKDVLPQKVIFKRKGRTKTIILGAGQKSLDFFKT